MAEMRDALDSLRRSRGDSPDVKKESFGGPAMLRDVYRKAVENRDDAFDGAFVFAAWSTGIYCRPVCPSRRPDLNRVSFFLAPAEAEAAGYRACLRCHPAAAQRADSPGTKVLAACRYIEDSEDEIPTLEVLAKRIGMSPYHLQRVFKRALGVTPRQYADARRLDRLKARLRKGEAVAPAMYDAGYGSSSRLYEKAPRQLGMTPAAYRRGGVGEHIRYTVARSALGPLLVAGTTRGICRVALGRTAAQCAAMLHDEYPSATIARDDRGLRAWVQPLVDYLDGDLPLPRLPIDIRATAFQRRVWEALQAIPEGTTRSYEEIARRIGRPRATRAVARACATNPVALVIPCHRVIRKNGELGGYGYGIERKKKLLAIEKRKD